jgi:hypothetical protein
LEAIAFSVVVLVLWALCLALVVALDPAASESGMAQGRSGGPHPVVWLARFRLWHVAVSILLASLVYAWMAQGPRGGPWWLIAFLLVVFLFVRAWKHEFVRLMLTPERSFPGRYDRLIWAALMVLLPPVGIGFFRAYRRAIAAETDGEAAPIPATSKGAAHDLS